MVVEGRSVIRNAKNARGCRLFSRGVIFTRARVLLALLSLRKNGGLLVVYILSESLAQATSMYEFQPQTSIRSDLGSRPPGPSPWDVGNNLREFGIQD